MKTPKIQYRLLNNGERICTGDIFYNPKSSEYKPTTKIGATFNRDAFHPMFRKFEVNTRGKMIDVDPDKKKVKKFDLRKVRKIKHLLIKRGTALLDAKFDPDQMSTSRDNCYVTYHNGDGQWLNTNELEGAIIEYIDDFGKSLSK